MGYIVLDESGDLGFDFTKKKTSKFFVITLMFLKKKDLSKRLLKIYSKDLLRKK